MLDFCSHNPGETRRKGLVSHGQALSVDLVMTRCDQVQLQGDQMEEFDQLNLEIRLGTHHQGFCPL